MSETDTRAELLRPYRVLDLTNELGELAGRILADLGADVIKIEPPGGDLSRWRPPFYADDARPGAEPRVVGVQCQQAERGAGPCGGFRPRDTSSTWCATHILCWSPLPPGTSIRSDWATRRSRRSTPRSF